MSDGHTYWANVVEPSAVDVPQSIDVVKQQLEQLVCNNQTNISALCRAEIYPLLSHSYFYFVFIKLYIYNNVHIAYALVRSGLKNSG